MINSGTSSLCGCPINQFQENEFLFQPQCVMTRIRSIRGWHWHSNADRTPLAAKLESVLISDHSPPAGKRTICTSKGIFIWIFIVQYYTYIYIHIMCNHVKICAYIYINVNLNIIINMGTQKDMLYKPNISYINIKIIHNHVPIEITCFTSLHLSSMQLLKEEKTTAIIKILVVTHHCIAILIVYSFYIAWRISDCKNMLSLFCSAIRTHMHMYIVNQYCIYAYAADRALGLSYMTFYHIAFELKTQNQSCLRVILWRCACFKKWGRIQYGILEPSTTSNPHPAAKKLQPHIISKTGITSAFIQFYPKLSTSYFQNECDPLGCSLWFKAYPSSHSHGCENWVPPIAVIFQILPFSIICHSTILGERVHLHHRKFRNKVGKISIFTGKITIFHGNNPHSQWENHNFQWKITIFNGKSPFSLGNTSSNHWCSSQSC